MAAGPRGQPPPAPPSRARLPALPARLQLHDKVRQQIFHGEMYQAKPQLMLPDRSSGAGSSSDSDGGGAGCSPSWQAQPAAAESGGSVGGNGGGNGGGAQPGSVNPFTMSIESP